MKPVSDRRLSDLVSVGVLTRVFPPGLVDEVIAASGRTEQRSRSLPARVMAYFSTGMALYSEGSYEDVLGQLTDGLAWASGWSDPSSGSYRLPSKSAIFQARVRLGAEPVAGLFTAAARPIATEQTPGAWLAGRRLVAIDETCLDVADTAQNAEHFGRPGVNKGEKAASRKPGFWTWPSAARMRSSPPGSGPTVSPKPSWPGDSSTRSPRAC